MQFPSIYQRQGIDLEEAEKGEGVNVLASQFRTREKDVFSLRV